MNQAQELARVSQAFLDGAFAPPDEEVLDRLEWFHRDALACGVSALALGTNAPQVLRDEAEDYPVSKAQHGASLLGSATRVRPEKAVAANCSAVREWDANGTNFGYNLARKATRGEFGHNDFYPVVQAAAQQRRCDGRKTVLAMLLLDEIRGRLAEVFALRTYKIDHVVHGAIASAVVYGTMLGATVEQIESALGLLLAHYIPFRAIRAGHQLSDSKGASAALSAEMAVLSVHRAMRGFIGPQDIFRNPEAIFCLNEKPARPHESPFDLTLTVAGRGFAIMDMHFKLGLYEHQSAGAIEGVLSLFKKHPQLLRDPNLLDRLDIQIYEPAFSIIGDPAKRDPHTRQSADHSMLYIIGTLLRKAFEAKQSGWRELMLMPEDYGQDALYHPLTRQLMQKIQFMHGGLEFDSKYPEGIPTQVTMHHAELGSLSSGLVMFPLGHARNTSEELTDVLTEKFARLTTQGVVDPEQFSARLHNLRTKSADEISSLYDFSLRSAPAVL